MAVIGLDFDGVLNQMKESTPGEFKPPIDGALHAVTSFISDGFDVWIYTARTDLKEVRFWLEEHGFPKLVVTNEKLPADIYVDDNGYRFYDWSRAVIEDIEELAGGKDKLAGGKLL